MDFFFIKNLLFLGFINRITLKYYLWFILLKKRAIELLWKIFMIRFGFFCILIYIIYYEEKRKVQIYRVAIKLSTMSAILLDMVSVFSSYAKNTIYTLYDTFRLSLDTGLWCIHRNSSNFETRKRLLMNVYIHVSVKY